MAQRYLPRGYPCFNKRVQWEQDYAASPPGLCLQNGTTCSQGLVPVFAVNATKAADIQAGVEFALRHNLRVAIKASGHDYLGWSTAKGSLLLWTQYLKNINFTDSFVVGGVDQGSAVTVGSGAGLQAICAAMKAVGKIVVGGSAATVAAAGGYIQGAGHSVLSPIYGLAADNVLGGSKRFDLRILGSSWRRSGSWGVIISATFRTFPTFQLTIHQAYVHTNSSDLTAAVMAAHARHIFDWDVVRAGQYFWLVNNVDGTSDLGIWTYFSNLTSVDASAQLAPLLTDVAALGATVSGEDTITGLPNDILTFSTPIGSRLIPATAYANTSKVGETYKTLIDGGTQGIHGILVAGGKVSENANISSAVLPKWRTAKTHNVLTHKWNDTTTPAEVESIKQKLTNEHVPTLAELTGESESGAYLNEADVREPNWQTTFFGVKYPRLLTVKATYDPVKLIIVSAGVGSERWDAYGLCRI
ncbi:FAD-binding domain-containing protein [Auriscalpium vulgare]|uniref:FAD-binding domain-containing protein n=1 Tax=Auriscalpium vulgare TaxID=40419 RepID=A0ACB8RLE8_9AGAM|nr:FAD-binding domain-containing protein [Auriscalpium vulgare]